MKLLEICKSAEIKCPVNLENIEVEGISSRSNEIKKNYVFVKSKNNAKFLFNIVQM